MMDFKKQKVNRKEWRGFLIRMSSMGWSLKIENLLEYYLIKITILLSYYNKSMKKYLKDNLDDWTYRRWCWNNEERYIIRKKEIHLAVEVKIISLKINLTTE